MIESCDAHIVYRQEGAVFIIQMNRPAKKNALLQTMYRALAEGIKHSDADDSINAVLLCGTSDCFTSGNDVNDFVAGQAPGADRPSVQFMKALADSRKPIVAAVNGLAIGIGTTMLMHCDLVYAADSAYLHLPFTQLGLCPEAGSSWLAPAIMGHQRASELLLLGERFGAAKAQEYGLVNEVMSAEQVYQYALDKAKNLAALPSEAVQTSKHLIKRAQSTQISDTISLELVNFSRLLNTPDAQAITQAFLNKKKA
jgi:enoyl-CoA hydratase/carnithine racemase